MAQADDALRELRRQLRVSAQLIDFKKNTVGGTSQRMNTKTRTLMLRFHDKTHRCARRYTAAYNALCTLNPPGDWQNRLRPLDHAKDLRLPGRDKEKDKNKDERESEGKREVSWIWLAPRRDGDKDVGTGDEYSIGMSYLLHGMLLLLITLSPAMRVEWAKMRARSHRWTEEVLLLTEEMRRIIVYCDWKSRWWLNQGTRRSNTTPELANGLSAYAMKQSNMYKGFAGACGRRWFPLLLKNSIPVEWPSEFR